MSLIARNISDFSDYHDIIELQVVAKIASFINLLLNAHQVLFKDLSQVCRHRSWNNELFREECGIHHNSQRSMAPCAGFLSFPRPLYSQLMSMSLIMADETHVMIEQPINVAVTSAVSSA